MASRDENEELDQNEPINQEQEVEEAVEEQNAEEQEEEAENNSEFNESTAEVAIDNGESRVSSDNDSDEEFAGFGEDEIEATAKKRAVVSDERFFFHL